MPQRPPKTGTAEGEPPLFRLARWCSGDGWGRSQQGGPRRPAQAAQQRPPRTERAERGPACWIA
eukprot:5105288-Heterocapsa_arctica.AAC.1